MGLFAMCVTYDLLRFIDMTIALPLPGN